MLPSRPQTIWRLDFGLCIQWRAQTRTSLARFGVLLGVGATVRVVVAARVNTTASALTRPRLEKFVSHPQQQRERKKGGRVAARSTHRRVEDASLN